MDDSKKEETESAKEDVYSRKKVVRKVEEDEKLPFTVHLEELRWRLIYCVVTIAVLFVALYAFSDKLFELVRKPITVDLVFLAPAEAFFVYVKISIYIAIFISTPMLLYQIWQFIAPGLFESERKYTAGFVIFGTLFFLIGASFCYFLVLPMGLEFLLGYAGAGLKPMISVGNYISFIFKMTLAFGVIFEMPIVIVFFTKLGFVTPETLRTKRGYLIVGSFVVASILTPPDIFTQVIMALPIILLFEMSLLVAKFFVPKPIEEEDEEQPEESEPAS